MASVWGDDQGGWEPWSGRHGGAHGIPDGHFDTQPLGNSHLNLPYWFFIFFAGDAFQGQDAGRLIGKAGSYFFGW